MQRKFPRPLKKIVVKIGSSLIATYKMKPRTAQLRSLVKQISLLKNRGVDVVLVSSGAIVLGLGELNESVRPTDLAQLQARAAIGQSVLMKLYNDLFKKNKLKCGQVLLTWEDFDNRERFVNARNTLEAILDAGVIPIINENDTISTDEIKFGDNDKLAALVASLIHADLFLILSDVEGLYDLKGEEKKIFEEIKEITREIEGLASGPSDKNVSRGGMIAKLHAIKIATHANIPCVIGHGELENVLLRIFEGEKIGTLFVEKEEKLLSRKHWISFGAKPKGSIVVDDGAKRAIVDGGRSLLLPGVVSFKGHFNSQEVVVICDQNDVEIGRGIINYSSTDLQKLDEKKDKRELIHRDDLVLSTR